MTLELTIIVPAFNEAHRLAEGMKRFDAAVCDGAVDLERTEVVVIDDGSTDGTTATARSLLSPSPPSPVVSLPRTRGRGRPFGQEWRWPGVSSRRVHGCRHGHRPAGHTHLGLRPADHRPGHRFTRAGRLDGGEHLCRPVGNGPALQSAGHDRDRTCGCGTPSAASRPSARRPPVFSSTWCGSIGSPSTWRSWPGPSSWDCLIAEVPVQWRHVVGSTVHPSTTRSPCWPTSAVEARAGTHAPDPERDGGTAPPIVRLRWAPLPRKGGVRHLAHRVGQVVVGASNGRPHAGHLVGRGGHRPSPAGRSGRMLPGRVRRCGRNCPTSR